MSSLRVKEVSLAKIIIQSRLKNVSNYHPDQIKESFSLPKSSSRANLSSRRNLNREIRMLVGEYVDSSFPVLLYMLIGGNAIGVANIDRDGLISQPINISCFSESTTIFTLIFSFFLLNLTHSILVPRNSPSHRTFFFTSGMTFFSSPLPCYFLLFFLISSQLPSLPFMLPLSSNSAYT